jgi:hypothetical protein
VLGHRGWAFHGGTPPADSSAGNGTAYFVQLTDPEPDVELKIQGARSD